MSLPNHQQITLDQIERVMHAADLRLKSMFAAFHHSVRVAAMPAREIIRPRSPRRLLVICALIIGLLGLLVLSIRSSGNACPGPPFGPDHDHRGPVSQLSGRLEQGRPLAGGKLAAEPADLRAVRLALFGERDPVHRQDHHG